MASPAARSALTEEQRQQIIAKLLSERRSAGQQGGGGGGGGAPSQQQRTPASALPAEERAAKLQELISRRAAAKQQQVPASYGQDALHRSSQQQHHHHQPHHAVQQQPHFQQQQQHPQQQLRPQQSHSSHQQHHQHQHHHQRGRHSSSADSLHGTVSQDPLLSPGSTASIMSAAGAAGGGASAATTNTQQQHRHHHHQKQHHAAGTVQQQHHPQQQQLPHPRQQHHQLQQLHDMRSPDLCSRQQQQQPARTQTLRGLHSSRPQQQQQQQRGGGGGGGAAAGTSRQQQQQQPRSLVAKHDALLSQVLEGPVDISDLWAAGGGVGAGRRGSSSTAGNGLVEVMTATTTTTCSSAGYDDNDSYDGGDLTPSASAVTTVSGSTEDNEGASDSLVGYQGEGLYDDGVDHNNGSDDVGAFADAYLQQGAAGVAGGVSQHSGGRSWRLSGSLTLSPSGRPGSSQQQHQELGERQQRLLQLQELHQQLQDKKRQQGGSRTSAQHTLRPQPPHQQHQQQHFGQQPSPSPPAHPRLLQQQQQHQPLPVGYPASRSERLQQLAQPKGLNRHKYDQMRAEAEQQVLQQCSFTPKTGRGPQHRCTPSGPASERLYKAAAEKKARLEHKAALMATTNVEVCTFQPQTNAAANARVLESYEYVPLHKRLGQVMRSRSEKLAHIQQQVEAEVATSATFAPRINRRSSMLASRSRSCSRMRGGDGGGSGEDDEEEGRQQGYEQQQSQQRSGGHGGGGNRSLSAPRGRVDGNSSSSRSPYHSQRDQQLGRAGGGGGVDGGSERDVSRGRSRERGSLRRTWSAHNLSASNSTPAGRSRPRPEDSPCTFAPSINARSQALLQASGDIPLSFLQRQEYFDRLAREKRQLLQLAVEDQHCSFLPSGTGGGGAGRTRSTSRSGRSDSAGAAGDDGSMMPYLDRIERLAYADKRRMDSSRSALAAHLHSSECTFKPTINPRSARMARATPLQELYENSKGRLRRDSVALALELQEQAECTFVPNLHKPKGGGSGGGRGSQSPPEAKLSLSADEVACVVERLYTGGDQLRAKEARVGEALSYQQYQELKACTFKPDINRDVPKQQGPVLVRGLGRFLELKDMAKQQADARAALEAKVFIAQPRSPTAPFTIPQPFRLGPSMPSGYEARRQRAVAEAEAAVMGECTFAPRINTHHKSRQQRVAELLGEQQ